MTGHGRFVGAFFRSLDGKSRFILPAELRDVVPEEERKRGFILTAGVDQCIFVFTESVIGQVLKRIEEQAYAKARVDNLDERSAARQFVRTFAARASRRALDRQGRILVPEDLKLYASITRDMAIIGNVDHIELWDADRWRTSYEKFKSEYERVAQEFF